MTIHKLIRKQTSIAVLFTMALSLLLFSCKVQRAVPYLQGPIDTAALSQVNLPEPTIQKGDLVGITVFSDNPEATAIFNQQMSAGISANGTGATSTGGSSPQMPGYLVNNEGNIQFPSLGQIHIEGLTKAGLALLLNEKLTPYLMNPYCNIRFLNYKFTVLGEVSNQGVYTAPGEKVNILEALGMAGDLTPYGLKDSIMVIRETNGKRSFGNLNVSRADVLASPYYYLQQNDIVIVKAHPKKPAATDQTINRNRTIITTIASLVTTIAVIINLVTR
ncbi:polysaccharide biosynthesis/export family protein [Agriterribacter humi]|uniref:polysaccharide biosynthesis/export family protein n=1 Tax=Agriterribacter humi TaxID=1104781 RepID=UPI0012650B81|nr:polysaccharide biosynthesis/export family protein [Agriterribacter humi]